MKVYISIPISGKDYRKQREHADDVARSLSRQGHIPVSPFNIYAGKCPTYEDHLCYNMRVLMDCDAIVFCKGWEHSFECLLEYSYVQLCEETGRKKMTAFVESEIMQ